MTEKIHAQFSNVRSLSQSWLSMELTPLYPQPSGRNSECSTASTSAGSSITFVLGSTSNLLALRICIKTEREPQPPSRSRIQLPETLSFTCIIYFFLYTHCAIVLCFPSFECTLGCDRASAHFRERVSHHNHPIYQRNALNGAHRLEVSIDKHYPPSPFPVKETLPLHPTASFSTSNFTKIAKRTSLLTGILRNDHMER